MSQLTWFNYDSLVLVIYFCKMSYKLDIRKGIYNLVGRMRKRDIVDIYREQDISLSKIYPNHKELRIGNNPR